MLKGVLTLYCVRLDNKGYIKMEKYNSKKDVKIAQSATIDGIKYMIRQFYYWDNDFNFTIGENGEIQTPEGRKNGTIVKEGPYGYVFCEEKTDDWITTQLTEGLMYLKDIRNR